METTGALGRRRAVGALSGLALIGAAASVGAAPARASPPGRVIGATAVAPVALGTMQVTPGQVAASGAATLIFTYTADPNSSGLSDGTVSLTVPGGWTAPTTSSGATGSIATTANCGSVNCVPSVNNMTVTISYIMLDPGNSFTITYTDATAPSQAATFDFTAQVTPAFDTSTADLPPIPVTTCASGVGVMTVTPQTLAVSTARTLTFTYTAAGCGLLPGGAIAVDVPHGWTPPSAAAGTPGYSSASAGTVTTSGSRITITNATLKPGDTLTLTYAQAVPVAPGYPVFYTYEQFGSGGTLAALLPSPQITVLSASSPPPTASPSAPASATSSGSPVGTGGPPTAAVAAAMTVSPATVTVSRRSTLTFTYTAPGGGLPPSGVIALTVPRGWTAPTPQPGAPGYTSTSAGTVSVSHRRITVTGTTLAPRGTLTITYHDATAPRSPGAAEFRARESLSGAGGFSALAQSPVVTVAAVAGPGPSWLVPLLVGGVVAASAAAAALAARLLRRRAPLSPGANVAAVPRPDPPRVVAVRDTGDEPALTVRVEPRPGTAVSRTEEVKS